MAQAVCKIQAFSRAFFAAHQYQLARFRLIKFQAVYRGTKEQTKYKQALARVRNLQAVYRGYAQRTKYQLVRFLALRLQAEYRRICAKRTCELTRNAASKIHDVPGESSVADTRIQVDASFAEKCNVSAILSAQASPTLSPAFVAPSSSVRSSPASHGNITPEATASRFDKLLVFSNGNRGPAKYESLSFLRLLSALFSCFSCLAVSDSHSAYYQGSSETRDQAQARVEAEEWARSCAHEGQQGDHKKETVDWRRRKPPSLSLSVSQHSY